MWQAWGTDGRDGLQRLDLAYGPAPRSPAFALANLGARVTLLNWGRVLQAAPKFAADLGVDNQVTSLWG
jgi:hypothetical protein